MSKNKIVAVKWYAVVIISILCKCLYVKFSCPETCHLKYFFIETAFLCFFITQTEKFRLILLPLVLINAAQAVHLIATGSLIVSQTLLNLREADDLGKQTLIRLVYQSIIYLMMFVPEFSVKKLPVSPKKIPISLLVLFLILAVAKSKMPIHSFISALSETVGVYNFQLEKNDGTAFLHTNIVSSAQQTDIPFSAKGMNIILIFAESWSSGVTSQDLTPNLWNLKNNSISFNNYFNHTFATYRGLYGQLISGYMMLDRASGADILNNTDQKRLKQMYDKKTESFASVLSDNGYHSEFISCENKTSHVATLMNFLDFDKVLTAEDYNRHQKSISDKEMYEFLWRQANRLKRQKKPFLLAAHVGGTHYGQDSTDIKYKDGKNAYLNTYHNQDYWLGKFLNKFNNSPLSKNTIIVFTADHAAFICPLFTEAFPLAPDMIFGNFVSHIPLVIYKKGEKPLQLNAENKNSLALVPTILDLLSIRKVNNHFLGYSLFDKKQPAPPFSSLTISGTQFIATTDGKPKEIKADKQLQDLLYRFYGYLER